MNLPKQETRPATSYRLIPLTQGQFAIVDAADFDWLNQWKWYARWNPGVRGFYASRKSFIDGKMITIQMHREILGIPFGDKRKGDHREPSCTLDNRRSNLRIATHSQNLANQRLRINSKTGFKGVSFFARTGKWRAYIRPAGRQLHLGYFATAEEASKAYKEAAISLYADFHRF